MTTGRQQQQVPLVNPGQRVALSAAGVALVAVPCWWLARALTAGVPLTIRGLGLTMLSLSRLETPPPLTVLVFLTVTAAVTAAGWWVRRWWRRHHGGTGEGTATRTQVRTGVGAAPARATARYTRALSATRGLNLTTCPVPEIGWQIGTCHGEPVILTLEDQVGVFGRTGSGKSRYLMVGAALDAPGALVATSTKLRDFDAIVTARARRGRVYVWDPLRLSNYPQDMVWNPVAGAEQPTVAYARGAAFAGGITKSGDGAAQFFRDTAAQVMTRLLMAAARTNRTMWDVVRWAVELDTRGTAAVNILRDDPNPDIHIWGDSLRTLTTGGDTRTTGNVKATLATKVEPLLDPVIIRQLIPHPGADLFDPTQFVHSTDTLIMVTDDNAEVPVASLSTMLLNAIVDAAKAAAATAESDVLDPPLTIVGDEIANVAPLPKLPALLSDSRGLGIRWVIAMQSGAQIDERWGDQAGKAIRGNLTVSIVLGGLQDAAELRRFSDLCGKVDVTEVSGTLNSRHDVTSHGVTSRERTVIRPEEIAQLPPGVALVLKPPLPPMRVLLTPYDRRPDGDQVMAEKHAAAAARRAAP